MSSRRTLQQREIIERRRRVAELRLSGVRKQVDVAARLGYSLGTINGDFRAIDKQWQEETMADIDAEKRMDLARIESLIAALWPKAIKADTYSIDRIVTLMQHKAKLLGTEAPVKREDKHSIEITMLARQLAESDGLDANDILAEATAILAGAQSGDL